MTTTSPDMPGFSGTLDRTPFAELLMQLDAGQCQGTLVLRTLDGQDGLLVRDGRVVAAHFAHHAPTVSRGLVPFCGEEEGEFVLLPGDQVSEHPEAQFGVVDPISFLTRALRVHAPRGAVLGVRRSYEQLALAVQPHVDLNRFGLLDRELKVVELLRARPLTAPELEVRSTVPVEELQRLIYLFQVTGLVAPVPQQNNRGSSQVRSRVVPPVSTPAQADARGSTPSRAIDALRHGLRSSGRAPAVPSVPTFEAMSSRAQVRLVEGLCRRHEFDEAEAVVERMVLANRHSPDAHAMRAWVLYQRAPGGKVPRPELMEALTTALHLEQHHPRALYLKGCVLRESGRSEEARSYFELVRDCDPRVLGREDPIRVAAERELRIAAIRRKHR